MPVTGYFDYHTLYKTLSASRKTRVFDQNGGWIDGWTATGMTFQGVLASATTRELQLAAELQYPVTHTIIANGPPVAGVGQRLAVGSFASGVAITDPNGHPLPGIRQFQIQNVDNAGELGIATVYHAEEVK